jgi:hypothetical protein
VKKTGCFPGLGTYNGGIGKQQVVVMLVSKPIKKEEKMATKRVVEDSVNLLDNLLGKKVFVQCARFFYEGQMTAVNGQFLELTNTRTVHSTGDKKSRKEKADWEHVEQHWGDRALISLGAIEVICELSKP